MTLLWDPLENLLAALRVFRAPRGPELHLMSDEEIDELEGDSDGSD